MMGFITALVYFALVLLAIGTTLALFTSWRDGCLGKDLAQIKTGLAWVYHRLQKFTRGKK
jgi:hypothetical protein